MNMPGNFSQQKIENKHQMFYSTTHGQGHVSQPRPEYGHGYNPLHMQGHVYQPRTENNQQFHAMNMHGHGGHARIENFQHFNSLNMENNFNHVRTDSSHDYSALAQMEKSVMVDQIITNTNIEKKQNTGNQTWEESTQDMNHKENKVE